MKLKSVGSLAVLIPLIWGVKAQERTDSGSDYLHPVLRQRVERLKANATEPTTSVELLRDRLATLWEWANAYSLTGGPVPGAFPQLASNANRGLRRLPPGGPQLGPEQVADFIAQYTREFQIKDESPRAIGELTLSSSGPFRAGEFVSVSATYRVGRMPMAVGGGIAIG